MTPCTTISAADDPGFIIMPARYAGRWSGKPQFAVHCVSDGSGMKTRAMRLCAAFNMRWSNRERAYITSPAKVEKLKAAFAAGKDARLGFDRAGRCGFTMIEG